MKRQTPERGVLRAVLDLLTAERIWHVRINTGKLPVGRLDGRVRYVSFGHPGMADVMAIVPVRFVNVCPNCGLAELDRITNAQRAVWIECKAPRGRQSPAQKKFQAEVEAEGHSYLLARDVSQVQRFLRERAA